MTNRYRVVLDTNIIGSVLLGGRVAEQFSVLLQAADHIDMVYDDLLIAEIRRLAAIPYFQQRGITQYDVDDFLSLFVSISIKVFVTSQVRLGRDSKDHFLLSLCRDARAQFLVTGDRDLLIIKQYGSTAILTINEFVDKIPTLST